MGKGDRIYSTFIYEVTDWGETFHVTDGNGDFQQSTEYPKSNEGVKELIADLELQKEGIENAIKKLKSYTH